ncbi:MAG: lysylphosphatidylglycerol synthase transmembrane domain-containing protein [Candidatus Omnitrophota bacterium]
MKIFKKALSILARISISVALLFFLFREVDKKSTLEIVKHSNIYLLFLAFFVLFLSGIIALFRWEMLLKATKINLSLRRVIASFSGGIFFNLFLPSTIGGDVVRSIDLSSHTQKPKEVMATVFLDRLSGYVGLVLVSLFSVIFGRRFIEDKSVLIAVAVITLILIAILLVLFNRFIYSKISLLLHSPNAGRIRELIQGLHREIHYFRDKKMVLFNNLLFSLVIQVLLPITSYITALSLGVNINPVYFFIFIPVISAITLLPISIGGLGVRENITVLFFASVGMSHDLALAISLLNSFFILIFGLIGGLTYVLTLRYRRLQRHKPSLI